MSDIIKIEGLHFRYTSPDGRITDEVLKGIDLTVKQGEFVAASDSRNGVPEP